tara:strand:- start:149 stop:625 length:477 start_codon:yes stop_codon:yes gene_type:complete
MKNTVMNFDLFTFENGIATYNGKERPQYNVGGYIYINAAGKLRILHRLIALKYIPNPNNLPQVDHIDDDKTNNSVDNLQWLSISANSKKAYANQGFKLAMNKGAVSIMAKKGDEQLIFPSVGACARHLGRSQQGVSKVLNGEWGRCAGYRISRVTIID